MEKTPQDNLKKKKLKEEKVQNDDKNKLNEENYIPNFIKRYGKEMGLPNLKMNENNVVSLCFHGKINVDIAYDDKNNQCVLASPICYIPNKDRGKFYEQLLISNNEYNKNGGLNLGIEEKENRVVFSYTFIANTFSYLLFKTVLTNFAALSERNILKFEEF